VSFGSFFLAIISRFPSPNVAASHGFPPADCDESDGFFSVPFFKSFADDGPAAT
jgi:hypothetical protein